MLPVLEGIIRRRILLNYRADPEAVQRLLPAPLEALTQNGFAIVGICLIGMERLRPKGLPSIIGMNSENMAHRVAIRYPTPAGLHDGVFVWRRDTDHCLSTLLGGRFFPGVYHRAQFEVEERGPALSFRVETSAGESDVALEAMETGEWQGTAAFPEFAGACEFFRRGDCGFSCTMRGDRLEGLQLRTKQWVMRPLRVSGLRAAFYENADRFPAGSLEFDSALIMRGVEHEWHELPEIPELAAAVAEV